MGQTILVIDSDPKFLKSLNQIGQRTELTIVSQEKGKKAVDEAESLAPDLIFLCLELGDMNGYMVCKRLRENDATAAIPIVITSEKAQEKDFEKHRKLKVHADEYLKKPIKTDRVREVLTQHLGVDLEPDESQFQDLSEIFSLDDSDIDLKPIPKEAQTQEMPVADVAMATKIEEKDREIEYLKKELAAFKPMMKQLGALEKKNAELEKTIEEQAKQPKEDSSKNDALVAQIEDERAKTESLEKDLNERKNRCDELEAQVSLLQNQVGQAQDLDMEVRELNERVATLKEENQSLKSRVTSNDKVSENRVAALHEEIDELEGALKAAKKNNRELEDLVKELREAEELKSTQLSALEQEAAAIEDKESSLQKQIDSLKSEHSVAMSQAEVQFAKRFSEREAELQEQIDGLSHNRDELLAKLDSLENSEEAHERKIAELERSFSSKISDLETERDQNQKEAQQQINELKRESEEQRADWQEQKSALEIRLQSKEEELRELRDKNRTDLEREKQAAASKIERLQKDLDDMKATHEKEWEAYIKTVTVQKNEMREKAEALEDQLSTIRDELSETKTQAEEREAQLLKTIKEKADDHHKEMELQVKAIENLSAQKETFQGKLSESLTLVDRLEKEMESLKDEHQQAVQSYENQIQELTSEHRERVEQLEAKCVVRQNDLNDARSEIDRLKDEVEDKADLERQLNRVKLGHDTLKMRLDRALEVLEGGMREIRGTSEELSFEE